MKISDLKTPAAIVDLDVVLRNTSRMSQRIRNLGANLRPHVKTHKCVEAARLQVRGHFGGITVSTLAEAWHFLEAGFEDITYAFPAPIDRLEEISELNSRLERFNLLADNETTVRALSDLAEVMNTRLRLFLKVDCGDHRAGVAPLGDDGVRLAQTMADAPGIDFRGILTHGGHSYVAEDVAAVVAEERDVMTAFATRLRAAGIEVQEISVGSTPTMTRADDLAGVTEARPGNYVFFDADQLAIGSCALKDIAFSVLATVVGAYPDRNTLIVNAGALALSTAAGATHVNPDCGFGLVCSAWELRPVEGLVVYSLSQEHGLIRSTQPIEFDRFPIGSRLRIIPNHSCTATALFDRYHVVRNGEIVDEWHPIRGW